MCGREAYPHHMTCLFHVRFSHDRGDCFVQRTIDTTGVFQLSRGLLFDPSAASLLGYVMGVEGTGEEDEWRVVTLNFLSLLKRPCECENQSSTPGLVLSHPPLILPPSYLCSPTLPSPSLTPSPSPPAPRSGKGLHCDPGAQQKQELPHGIQILLQPH